MLRFNGFLSFEISFCLKYFKKQKASKMNGLITRHVRPASSKATENVKVPKYVRIAQEENLKFDDMLTKPQDIEEVEKIFQEIARGDAKIENRLRLLQYECMLRVEEEGKAPNVLTKKNWEHLLTLKSLQSRNKYLKFLYKTEKKKESEKIKEKLKKMEVMRSVKINDKTDHIFYGLSGQSIFLRIYNSTLLVVQELRALTNKLFASPIIFDCSYDTYMNDANTKNCAQQLLLAYSVNRMHPYPCSLQLFNLKKDGLLMKYLKNRIPNINEFNNHLEIFEKSYLDLYPKEKLVYLTPHTKNDLVDIKAGDIFIIGAFVDKGNGIPASLAKAKEEGLRMAKLPIDRYLLWNQGTKSLTLNNVLNILLDLRYYNDWGRAFKTIPIRNLKV